MSSDAYQLYVANTFKLAKTLQVKFSIDNDRKNEYLRLKYGPNAVDVYDPYSWRYHLHLAGMYHPVDVPMQVTSIDTLEKIDFTKDNLALHTATATAYQYGTRYYDLLVSQYPDQEDLILGILYPADLDTVVNAQDGTILSYPKALVEPQEITFIDELQSWLYSYLVRWNVSAFNLTDSWYPASMIGVLFNNMIPVLLNLRKKRCHTLEAHSFHIRQYLASHERLDRFMDYMTLKQQLFLYRNLVYINRNCGKQSVFTWLVEKLLTERYIPIAEYGCKHLSSFNDDLTPQYHFRKRPINTQYNVPEKDYFTLDELLAKELSLAKGNAEFIALNRADIDHLFQDSPSSVIQTKDLESSMLDYTDAVPYPLVDVLLNHWAYMASSMLYTAMVYYKEPLTGLVRMLNAEDAFIFMQYLTWTGYGYTIDTVPSFWCSRVVLPTEQRTVDDLLSVVDRYYIPSRKEAEWLVKSQPSLKKCVSTSGFFNLGYAIYENAMQQWYLISRTEEMNTRVMMENMVARLYSDRAVVFSNDGQAMDQWLKDRNLDISQYTPTDKLMLATMLFQTATGYETDPTKLLPNIQHAMITTLKQLSSYSIQVIQEINKSHIKIINWPALRIGDQHVTIGSKAQVKFGVSVLSMSGVSTRVSQVSMEPFPVEELSSSAETQVVVPMVEFSDSLGSHTADFKGKLPDLRFVRLDESTGYSDYLTLSADERRSLAFISTGFVSKMDPLPIENLEDVIRTHAIDLPVLINSTQFMI